MPTASELFADIFKHPEEAHREGLLIDPGNQFQRPGDYGLFFAIPSWWRSFIFWVLTPSEFMAYAYLCSQMGTDALAYPTGEHFKIDLMRTSKTSVYRYIRSLVEKGFILKEHRAPMRRKMTLRNVYQRPAPEYTLIALLESNLIDAELRPTDQRFTVDRAELKRHNSAIQGGLQRLLKGRYRKYRDAKNSIAKRTALIEGLTVSLERKRTLAKEAAKASKPAAKRTTSGIARKKASKKAAA